MKKLVLVLLAGLLLIPSEMFAAKYNSRRVVPFSSPFRSPSHLVLNMFLGEYTGDLAITPNHDTTLNILITRNGMTYLNARASLQAGYSYTNCLDFLGFGTYLMTLSTIDGFVDMYEITVEDD